MSNEQRRNGFAIKGDSEAWRQVERLSAAPDGAGAWMAPDPEALAGGFVEGEPQALPPERDNPADVVLARLIDKRNSLAARAIDALAQADYPRFGQYAYAWVVLTALLPADMRTASPFILVDMTARDMARRER